MFGSASNRRFSKPSLLTSVHLTLLLGAILCLIVLEAKFPIKPIAALGLMNFVPLATLVYRVSQMKNYDSVPWGSG
jgi:hypothetical protein